MKFIILFLLLLLEAQLYSYTLGLERVSHKAVAKFLKKRGKVRVGLITNHTGSTQEGIVSADVLEKAGFVITVIFTGEHGFDGKVVAGESVSSDSTGKIPIISLYGPGKRSIDVVKEFLTSIDTFIFDMQDSGMRHYTYISTLYQMLECAGMHKKPFVVLDRPNPLGVIMEGPTVDDEQSSFISKVPVPVRHGMTFGEIARYCNQYILKDPVKLAVVPLKEYKRIHGLQGELKIGLSPNIPNKDSILGYSFLGLIGEVSPFDVGVGTSDPFRYLALPQTATLEKNKWLELAKELKKNGVDSEYISYYNPRKKDHFVGLKITISDGNTCSTMQNLYIITNFFDKQSIVLSFPPMFCKALGTSFSQDIIKETAKKSSFSKKINDGLKTFYQKARTALIYKPTPRLLLLDW